MKNLELIKQKIEQIKQYNGLELSLRSTDVRTRRGVIGFEVDMCSNFRNPKLKKTEALVLAGIISMAEVSGRNRFTIYFAK